MKHHQITVHPGPCGATRCCGCYCQMLLCCTAPCTLCVIYREANLGDGRVAATQTCSVVVTPPQAFAVNVAAPHVYPVVVAPPQSDDVKVTMA